MAKLEGPEINISSIKVAGLGGLGMIAVIGAMAYVLPAVRAFALVSLVGGLLVGVTFIAYRRWSKPDPPSHPTLMVDTPSAAATETSDPVKIDSRTQLSPVASVK